MNLTKQHSFTPLTMLALICSIALSVCGNIFAAASGAQRGMDNEFLKGAFKVAEDIHKDIARSWHEKKQRIAELEGLMASDYCTKEQKARWKAEQARIQSEIDDVKDFGKQVDALALKGVDMVMTDALSGSKKKQEQEMLILNNKGALERHKETLKALFEPKNLVRTGAFLGLTTLGIATAIYLSKLGYRYAESHMNKPTLVRETSVHGIGRAIRDYISEFFTGAKPTPPSLSDIILSATHAVELNVLADDIKESYDCGLTLQNLLFYGPPGTGKTEFAKILATYSDLDYAIISGPDFAQFKDGEAVTEVHKLFAWLKNGKRPRIVFIDEADAVFRNRATLNKEGVEIVNAFLSHTGSNSDKFMFIFATNYENTLDQAVRSRTHKKFKFDLPTADERFLIFKLKLDKYIVRSVHNFERDGQEISISLTIDNAASDTFLKDEAARMNGFSGRDIDQLVAEIAIRGYRSPDHVVTKDMISKIVSSKIEQVKLDNMITAEQQKKMAELGA